MILGVFKRVILLCIFTLYLPAFAADNGLSHPNFIDSPRGAAPQAGQTTPNSVVGLCVERSLDLSFGLKTIKKPKSVVQEASTVPKAFKYSRLSGLNAGEIKVAILALKKAGYITDGKSLGKFLKRTNPPADGLIAEAVGKKTNLDDLYNSIVSLYKSPLRAYESASGEVRLPANTAQSIVPAKPKAMERSDVKTTQFNEKSAYEEEEPEAESAGFRGLPVAENSTKQRQIWIYETVGALISRGLGSEFIHGFKPSLGNLLNHSEKPVIHNLLGLVNSDFKGNLYDAYTAAGLNAEAIFQRGSAEFVNPYRPADLIRDLNAVGTGKLSPRGNIHIEDAVAKEAPPDSRRLRSLVVHYLLSGSETSTEAVAKLCSVDMGKRVDGPAVLNQLRALVKNRTLLDYLKVPEPGEVVIPESQGRPEFVEPE